MKTEETKSLSIIQPNRVTNARYDWTATQKNIMYLVIESLQNEMSYQPLLFDRGREYVLDLGKITDAEHYNYAFKEAEDFVGRTLHYDWKGENGKMNDTTTTIIASITRERGARFIRVEIPKMAIPVLLFIGKGTGFTVMQKTIAISLKSKHSKRMYELCCRWADKGGFNMSLIEFRQMMYLEKQYKDINRFREQVIDIAKKELKESADKWFEYRLEKVKSRSYNWIYCKVFTNDLKQKNAEKGVYPNVYNYLLLTFPPIISDKAMVVADKLADMQQLGAAWDKFRPLYEKYASGDMDAKHIMNTTKLILREDFNINAD